MPFFRKISTGQYYYSDTDITGEDFVEVTEAEANAREPAVALAVPEIITLRQFKLGLLHVGTLGEIDRLIRREDSPEGKARQVDWALMDTVARESDFVTEVCSAVSMSDDEINLAFIHGSTL